MAWLEGEDTGGAPGQGRRGQLSARCTGVPRWEIRKGG